MPDTRLAWLSATELAGLIRKKKVSPVDVIAWIPFTYPFNMPIGLQIVGRRFDDVTVLRASAAFERARPWAQHRPTLD